MMNPKISVLMPVYNAERYLGEAIESILEQSFQDFELCIINDGSTDHSRVIIEEYQKRDRRIVVIDNLNNFGLSRSLNAGIARSNGGYIARMDADDVSLPDRFAVQVAFLNDHPEIGVLGCLFREIDKNKVITSEEIPFPTVPDFLKWCFFFYNPIVHPSVLMRREVITSVHGYNAEVERSQDKDLWVRLFWTTQFTNIPRALIYLRKHDTNVSTTGYSQGLDHNSVILSQLESKIVGYSVSPDCARNIYRNKYPTDESVCAAVQVITDLYLAYFQLFSPSDEARHLIAKDVQHRVGSLLYLIPEVNREKMIESRPELRRILTYTGYI